MEKSINSFTKKENKTFILGDMKELGKYSEKEHKDILNKISKYSNLKILVGSDFYKLKSKIFGTSQNFLFFKNILELEKFLKKEKIKNKNILIKGSNSIKLFELKNKNLL
jgi:UDP-N-acetylmuramoyl-tripeptide--D-alanyl-D-alanine ligase